MASPVCLPARPGFARIGSAGVDRSPGSASIAAGNRHSWCGAFGFHMRPASRYSWESNADMGLLSRWPQRRSRAHAAPGGIRVRPRDSTTSGPTRASRPGRREIRCRVRRRTSGTTMIGHWCFRCSWSPRALVRRYRLPAPRWCLGPAGTHRPAETGSAIPNISCGPAENCLKDQSCD